MLSVEQQKWIDHLSDSDLIEIFPYDPRAEEVFKIVREKIQTALGKEINVEHHGATSLGISGQDEVDIYLPVDPSKFNQMVDLLTGVFGPPGSIYEQRARFPFQVDGKRTDVFVVKADEPGWKDSLRFENYLKNNHTALDDYRVLKETGHGLSLREYYRRKIEFINSILEKAN
ncbi:MAG: GrpB family protein [Candidatus Vogelbacteria bacterium]|nr:GrpB family protein [Candidatus Vogelbacteria bacterium]